MKTLSRALAIILVISGLMPLMATIFAATDPMVVHEMFNFSTSTSPELQISLVMMGAALIFASVTQFLAAVWVWKGKPEGLKLSLWVSIILIAVAVYIFSALSKSGLNDPSYYAVDLIKGLLILALTLFAMKKSGK